MIALKGTIRDFLQSPHCAANCLQHVRSSGLGAIVCKSRATNRALITCNMLYATWYEGTAQLLFGRIEITFIFSFILLAEPSTDEGGEETGVLGENPWRRASEKCHIRKPENSSPNRDSNPLSSIGGRQGKQTCLPSHHASNIKTTHIVNSAQKPATHVRWQILRTAHWTIDKAAKRFR